MQKVDEMTPLLKAFLSFPRLGHSKNQRTLPVACKALCNPRPNCDLVLSPIYSLVTFFHDCVSLPLSFALPGLLSTFW